MCFLFTQPFLSLNFQGISPWAKHLMNVLLANTCDVLEVKVWLSLRNTEQQRAWEQFDYFDQSKAEFKAKENVSGLLDF